MWRFYSYVKYQHFKNELCNTQHIGRVCKCIYNSSLSKTFDYYFFCWYCILYFSGLPIFLIVNIDYLRRFIRAIWVFSIETKQNVSHVCSLSVKEPVKRFVWFRSKKTQIVLINRRK